MSDPVWVFLGVLVGGAINIIAVHVQSKSSKSISEAQRDYEVRLGNDAFQRDNLLNLQSDLGRLKVVEGKARETDDAFLADRGTFGGHLPAVESEFESLKPLLYLRTPRIINIDLRLALREILDQVEKVEKLRKQNTKEAILRDMNYDPDKITEMILKVEEDLGEVLRKYL